MKKKPGKKRMPTKKFSLKLKQQGPNRAIYRKKLLEKLIEKFIRTLKTAFISLLALGTLAAAVDGSYRYYKSNDVLILKNVVCQGNKHFSSEQLIEIMKLELGTKLFDVTLSQNESALKKNAWIKDVKLRRQFPSSLKIQVDEYAPLALLYNKNQTHAEKWRGLNEKGKLLPDISPQKFDLPVLDGNIHVDDAVLLKISQFLMTAQSEYPHFYNAISQINNMNTKDVAIISREKNFRILVSLDEDHKTALEMWSLLISQYKNDFTENQTIDLRIPGKAYVS